MHVQESFCSPAVIHSELEALKCWMELQFKQLNDKVDTCILYYTCMRSTSFLIPLKRLYGYTAFQCLLPRCSVLCHDGSGTSTA